MKQIHSFDELQPGQRIFCVENERLVILKFLCKHPCNDNYALFLDENYEPIKKVYRSVMEENFWFIFEHTDDVWSYIYETKMEYHEKEFYRLREKLRNLQKT